MNSKKDYYELLGVSKTATDEEIKRAFRKLAKMYHPDNKETGDEAKFKEIGEAYAILSDPQKRKAYDQYGSAAFDGTGNFGGQGGSNFNASDIDLGDILRHVFGDDDDFGSSFTSGFSSFGGGRKQRTSRGSDIKVTIPLTFEEAAFGCEKTIEVNLKTPCKTCDGKGGFNEKTCSKCGGRGVVLEQVRSIFGVMQTQKVCPDCMGKGVTYQNVCSDCKGIGIVNEKKTIKIKVPEGVDSGHELRLAGKGNASSNGENGDLYVDFEIKEHPLFERQGNDIYLELPINVAEATLGCEKEIPTLTGNVILEIKPGTQNYTKLKLKGKGLKSPNSIMRGNMYVVVNIIIPTKLTLSQKKLFKELLDSNLDNEDEIKDFNRKMK